MPSNDVLWFKLDKELVASFAEADLVDFNWDDYVKYDEGQEIKLKARNVSYEMNGKKDFKEYSEIPARFVHSKGDAIALSPGVRIVVASPIFPKKAYRGRKETGRAVLFT